MTDYVTSDDGSRIAFDQTGSGPPIVLVSGMLCDRATTADLAGELSRQFSVINYDRRGRGQSGNTGPYDTAREVEDIAALIAAAGGKAAVYGHSSGAGLALHAAAAALPITKLVLHEPPYGFDDNESMRSARALAESVKAALAKGRRAEAIALFYGAVGMPPEMVEAISSDPGKQQAAPTMLHDFEVMGDFSGGTIPEWLVRRVTVPTLVLAGEESMDFFRDIAEQVAALLPDGRYRLLEGQDHAAPASAVAPVVASFLL